MENLERCNIQQKRELEYARARTSFPSSARKALEQSPAPRSMEEDVCEPNLDSSEIDLVSFIVLPIEVT